MTSKMKSLSMFIAFLLGSLVLCPAGVVQPAAKSDEAVLENIDAKRAVEIANEWKWTQKDIKTSIDSREVTFEFPDGKVKRIALPQDKMYIAIAPYIKNTHTWTNHVFSSCQGELTEKTFRVKAVDEMGNVLVDGDVATLKNGFFELWLPRDRKMALTIEYSGRTAKGMIETFDTSKTCITTFRLQ